MVFYDMTLEVAPDKKQGVLRRHNLARKVAVLHRQGNGDALVQDGRRILMIPGTCVRAPEQEEVAGKRRLELVKTMFAQLREGKLEDTFVVSECRRLGMLPGALVAERSD